MGRKCFSYQSVGVENKSVVIIIWTVFSKACFCRCMNHTLKYSKAVRVSVPRKGIDVKARPRHDLSRQDKDTAVA